MKDPFDRTKVVVRHLPPALPLSALMEQIDGRFSDRYKWFCFRPGKNSQKNQRYSRAYIDFKSPEDVVEFAEFFDGHVFVNEKGTQFKTIVEYAPSQRVPKSWSKKDGREGAIVKDPEYLEFLDLLAKPVENLPSAEIQLERKEAERAVGPKETLIVTPLMDFVRQKRAAKCESKRLLTNGRVSRKAGGLSSSHSSSASTKRASDKRRGLTSMYVLRDSTKNASGKEKTYVLASRRDDQQLSNKPISVAGGSGADALDDETVADTDGTTFGLSGTTETMKRRVSLKGKERDVFQATGAVSSVRNSIGLKQNQRREGSGRMIRSILINKEARQNQSSAASMHSEQQMLNLEKDKDKRPPRPNNVRSILKDHIASIAQVTDALHGMSFPPQVVFGVSKLGNVVVEDTGHAEMKIDMLSTNRSGEIRTHGSGRGGLTVENGSSHRHAVRRGPSSAHALKEFDGSVNLSEGKPPKRGATSYGSHEKQVWVQKSGSGS